VYAGRWLARQVQAPLESTEPGPHWRQLERFEGVQTRQIKSAQWGQVSKDAHPSKLGRGQRLAEE
jgi:hypothetical protein